jgi:hypothetical protein
MPFQTAYPDIPRVDIHTHIGRRLSDDAFPSVLGQRQAVKAACDADLALWIDLDGGSMTQWVQDPAAGMARIKRQGQGRVLGVLSIAGPSARLPLTRIEQLAPELLAAAAELSAASPASELFA